MLTITHTHTAGTLIDGTSRGDGTGDVLKANGWRWGRSISAWFVPQSRDRLPKLHTITRTKTAPEEAGFEVETEIDSTHRPTAEVEAGKIERQADRVDALAVKAERKSIADEAAWTNARVALDRLPEGGEPIKVGHHSEGRHRNAIAKADRAMSKSVEASAETTRAQVRADVATHATDARYRPVTVANRIDKLAAEMRDRQRRLDGHSHTLSSTLTEESPAATGARRDRLTAELEELTDKHAYWGAVRDEQISNGKTNNHSRDTVKKGDRVKIRGQWREVVRANAKTVSVSTGHSWTDIAPYAEIQQHERPE
jgi:hypothetical protein